MPNTNDDAAPMRMGPCPYCERTVLVYEEPPRCPICACPLDASTMEPFEFPSQADRSEERAATPIESDD